MLVAPACLSYHAGLLRCSPFMACCGLELAYDAEVSHSSPIVELRRKDTLGNVDEREGIRAHVVLVCYKRSWVVPCCRSVGSCNDRAQ